MNHKKEMIIKIAVNELMLRGIDGITEEHIADLMRVNKQQVAKYFQEGDLELLMDTVEYAGRTWVEKIKLELNQFKDTKEQLKTLVTRYTLGTKDHAASLSVYIDLWKLCKDGNEYVIKRLRTIYESYVIEFIAIVKEMKVSKITDKELQSTAWIMTILSDVLHIQSILLGQEIDYDCISDLLSQWTKVLL